MRDVLFITPNMTGSIVQEAMGTLQLASILKEKNISCEILPFYKIGDLSDFEAFLQNAINIIDELKPKIVSFYTRCDVYHIDLTLAKTIKENFPDIYIVCGGPQSDITSVKTIEQIDFVDFICCGEGEKTIYPFFLSLLNGKPDLTVDGLVYRMDGKVVKNPRPALLENLDELTMPDYSFLRIEDEDKIDEGGFPIEVGRGCPFGCTFCSTNAFWGRRYRLKSPQRIYEEVKAVHDSNGVSRFSFQHDMFTLNKKKVIETCDLLKTLDFPIIWGASARVDCIDKEMIDAMAEAGMRSIFLGIETGSPRMQKIINKNLDLEKTEELVEYIAKKGVRPTVSMIYGFPEENEEDISQTIALLGKLVRFKKTILSLHLCAFFVGTPMSEQYADQMKPVDYYSNETGDFAVEECKDIILNHPDLFTHMLEYKTELRQKLKYFEVFMHVWQAIQPVYQYISEKYDENRLIDMYYDFVAANNETLSQKYDEGKGKVVNAVIANDKFAESFKNDENYDVIADYYRLQKIMRSEEYMKTKSFMDAFCFDINTAGKYSSIKDYPRGKYMTVCKNGKFATFKK